MATCTILKGGELMKDFRRLLGRIVEICGTRKEFAKRLGVTQQTLTKKMIGKSKFTQSEILKSIEILELTTDDIPIYFFN